MGQFFQLHPENPQPRLVKQAVEIINAGGVVAFPTDSAYALGCKLEDKNALERIRRIRQLDDKHNFTLLCRDLSELGTYARVENHAFRLIKAHIPGPYTFILSATREVPKRLMHPKRQTIGLRVPDNPITLALLAELGEPMMSVTLIMPGEADPLNDCDEIRERLQKQVDLIIDGGACALQPTSVIDLVDEPKVIREGAGDLSAFK